MIGERARCRECVLDRRKLLDLGRRPGTISIVEVVAEKILEVLVIPGVGLVGLLRGFLYLLSLRLCLGRLKVLGWDLLEHGVLHHLLVQQLR